MMSILDNIIGQHPFLQQTQQAFGAQPQQAPQAPIQPAFAMPQAIPPKPQAQQAQGGQGAGGMPQGTMDMIMKLFAAGGI